MKGCKKVVSIVFPIKTIKDLVFFKIDTMFLFLREIDPWWPMFRILGFHCSGPGSIPGWG